jgi:hypothetical protein
VTTKKKVVAKKPVVEHIPSNKDDLNKYSLEQIIEWRNAASKRVSGWDVHLAAIESALKIGNKGASKDRLWIAKLNRHLNNKAFKYPTKPPRKKEEDLFEIDAYR